MLQPASIEAGCDIVIKRPGIPLQNPLEILGDASDSVGLIQSDWNATGNSVSRGGYQFTEYENLGGSQDVTLLIEDQVDVNWVT